MHPASHYAAPWIWNLTDIAVSLLTFLTHPPQSCNIQFRSLQVFPASAVEQLPLCEIHWNYCPYVSIRYFLQTFAGHMNNRGVPIEGCFSPDSKYVISGSSDGRVHAWNADTGYKVRVGTKSKLLTICFWLIRNLWICLAWFFKE